jgi:hypothetical protein
MSRDISRHVAAFSQPDASILKLEATKRYSSKQGGITRTRSLLAFQVETLKPSLQRARFRDGRRKLGDHLYEQLYGLRMEEW